MWSQAKPETQQETELVRLYPFLSQEDLDYWRARRLTGDPAPTLTTLGRLGRLNPLH
jgi:hypothetical protein